MIRSVLDNDLYKLTMQQAVLVAAPQADAVYRFTNRRPEKAVNRAMFDGIRRDIEELAKLRADAREHVWLAKQCPYFSPAYLEYLANYRFDPQELNLELSCGELQLSIAGRWHRTILWEVPLMAVVSRNHFLHADAAWQGPETEREQHRKAQQKAASLAAGGCIWADFGTRRRRNYATQDGIVAVHKSHAGFAGTSNVHLACKHGVNPIGTMAHEWIMAASVLWGLRHANKYALEEWLKIYQGQLGIALTDTFGSEAFFADFGVLLAKSFDGVRHDSADPFAFAERVIAHYRALNIDPAAKTIVFSDSLSVASAIELHRHCLGRIQCAFGIGTHFTNDFDASPALNIVVKLSEINGVPVVKCSDDAGKASGDNDALRVAKWTFGLGGLDE
jgi:nicotinate phosphoribosyltransferase